MTIEIVRVIVRPSDASKDLFIPKHIAEEWYVAGMLDKAILDGYYAGSYMLPQNVLNGRLSSLALLRSVAVKVGNAR